MIEGIDAGLSKACGYSSTVNTEFDMVDTFSWRRGEGIFNGGAHIGNVRYFEGCFTFYSWVPEVNGFKCELGDPDLIEKLKVFFMRVEECLS